jgi:hypothetical protein
MNNEKRLFSRIPFAGTARLQLDPAGENQQITVLNVGLIDVSLKGALIELPADTTLALHTMGSLILRLGSEEEIHMEVDVARVQDQIAGLHIHGIDLDSITHLRRLISMNLGDASLLDRDIAALLKPLSTPSSPAGNT